MFENVRKSQENSHYIFMQKKKFNNNKYQQRSFVNTEKLSLFMMINLNVSFNKYLLRSKIYIEVVPLYFSVRNSSIVFYVRNSVIVF